MILALFAYCLGLPSAWAFARYMQAVAGKDAVRAAAWDLAITATGMVGTLTLWEWADNSPLVLVGWMLGNASGTFLVVRRTP